MKTSYQLRNRNNPWRAKILPLIAVFVLGAVIFSVFDKWIVAAVRPVWSSENRITTSVKNIFSLVRSKDALLDENRGLKDKIAQLESSNALLESEIARGAGAREIFGRDISREGILAAVVVRPPETPYDMFLIDAGSDEGVGVGSRIALPHGPLLGSIVEVFDHTSRVKLYTSSGEKTNAVLERNNLPVILVGNGGGNFKLSLPRDARVEVGDRVLSPDSSESLLAVVGDIAEKPTDPFKEVFLASPTNIFGTRFVRILP